MDFICADSSFIKNPEKLPLNKLFLQYQNVNRTNKTESTLLEMLKKIEKPPDKYDIHYSIKSEKKPAIDKCWIQSNRRYVSYQPCYVQFDQDDNTQFLEKNQVFLECIQFFASCSFQQFWCYIAHEPRVAGLVINFLDNGIPPFAVKYLSTKSLTLYNEIYTVILEIFKRFITFFVSETEFLEEEFAIECLRKSNLVSANVIMNVCYLYSHSQKEFVDQLINFCATKSFNNVFLSDVETLIADIFDDLEQSCMPAKLGAFNPMYIEETALYVLEAAMALTTFTTFYKPAVSIALEQQFPHRLPHIYQKAYLDLYDMYDMKGDIGYDWSKLDELIKEWLALGRQCFIQLFNIFLEYCLDQILQFQNQQGQQEEYFEIYLALISTALDDEYFIRDYNKMHSVKDQFQLLIDNIPNFDKSQTEYLLQSLAAITSKVPEVNCTTELLQSSFNQPFPYDLVKSIYTTLNAASPGSNQPENVTKAIQMFEQLKKQWEDNPNCWLIDDSTHNIPVNGNDNWHNFDKPSKGVVAQKIAAVKEMLPDLSDDFILEQLECVDYRPEIVISHILDRGRSSPSKSMISHIGKKPQHADARDLLDDKTDEIKKLVLKASYTYEDDDDYDDRNEIYNTFEPDKDDSKLYRHLKQNNLEYDVISDPSSSEDEAIASSNAKPRDAFCENPEIVRARRAAQHGRLFKPSTARVDVIGKPKGQGQDSNTVHNRDKKNVQKSSRANHNRKAGAQWKRSSRV